MTEHTNPNGCEVTATVTYLDMEAFPPGAPPPRPMLNSAILRAYDPPVHFYRYLYDAVGRDYLWTERRSWSDEELATHLMSDKLELYILHIAGVPAGFAELDFSEKKICQLAYFGLTPDFIGRRIGLWFLYQAIELAWARPITRLLVSTCTRDHRKALSTYQRAGFNVHARGEKTIAVPPDMKVPEHAN
ncbi:MAG: GNAT family N-acetyltransferase [Micropepsaceae bacterium]